MFCVGRCYSLGHCCCRLVVVVAASRAAVVSLAVAFVCVVVFFVVVCSVLPLDVVVLLYDLNPCLVCPQIQRRLP